MFVNLCQKSVLGRVLINSLVLVPDCRRVKSSSIGASGLADAALVVEGLSGGNRNLNNLFSCPYNPLL